MSERSPGPVGRVRRYYAAARGHGCHCGSHDDYRLQYRKAWQHFEFFLYAIRNGLIPL